MMNLPESPFDYSPSTTPNHAGPSGRGGALPRSSSLRSATVDQLIQLVRDPCHRKAAIELLFKKERTSEDMAVSLWNSFNTIYILLQEITATYKLLTPTRLSEAECIRAFQVMSLLQNVASHPQTRTPFVRAMVPVYLYPFLNTTVDDRRFQGLRLRSLTVLTALAKADDPQIIHFFLQTEIFPLCLRCIDTGIDPSKEAATFIIMKILMEEEGLKYICGFADRFYSTMSVLNRMVDKIAQKPPIRLLRHTIQCYQALTKMPRAPKILRHVFPLKIRYAPYIDVIKEDPLLIRDLEQVVSTIMRKQ